MVAVIDYGMGNLHSVSKALESVGGDVAVTNNPQDISRAERIVLPGAGSFSQGIQHLFALNFTPALEEEVIVKKKPFLGICLGMQLAATLGHEGGVNKGLGWIDAEVLPFKPESPSFKIPHMGWNDVDIVRDSPIFKGIKSPTAFYFVHSYHLVPRNSEVITGECNHGGKFVAAVSSGNIHLVQFHPEKSQKFGLQILENFLAC